MLRCHPDRSSAAAVDVQSLILKKERSTVRTCIDRKATIVGGHRSTAECSSLDDRFVLDHTCCRSTVHPTAIAALATDAWQMTATALATRNCHWTKIRNAWTGRMNQVARITPLLSTIINSAWID